MEKDKSCACRKKHLWKSEIIFWNDIYSFFVILSSDPFEFWLIIVFV